MTRTSLAIGFALLCLTSGCRFSDPPMPGPWGESLSSERALPAEEPLAYRIGLAPVRLAYDPSELYRADPSRNASRPDTALLRRELRAALEASRLFSRAEPRGGEGEETPRVESLAWEENDDLLLEVELLDYHQAFMGHGDGYFPWLITYVFWIWPAWWMPGDSFGTEVSAEVRLRDVQGRHQPLLQERIRIRAEDVALTLTPSERDWAGFLDFGALWNIQESLEDNNWKSIERYLGPRARRSLWKRVLQLLEERVAQPLRRRSTELEARVRKRLGLAIGVGTFADARLGGAPHAEQDARAMAALWSEDAGGGLEPERDLRVLVGEQATREKVLAAIAAVGSQTTPSDEVVVYLATLGTTLSEGEDPRVLLHDSNRDALSQTTLSLEALASALRSLPAGRVLLVLDASFGGPQGGRTLSGTTTPPDSATLARVLSLGPGRVALLAAQPGQAARALEAGEAGLFTQVVREGIAGRADLDRDGRVDLRELFAHAREEVSGRAGLERSEQEPLAIGLPEASEGLELLGWPR